VLILQRLLQICGGVAGHRICGNQPRVAARDEVTEDPPSQHRPAVPSWTGRRAGPDADVVMAHHGDAVHNLAPGPNGISTGGNHKSHFANSPAS
jgi:hypothetical protein